MTMTRPILSFRDPVTTLSDREKEDFYIGFYDSWTWERDDQESALPWGCPWYWIAKKEWDVFVKDHTKAGCAYELGEDFFEFCVKEWGLKERIDETKGEI